MENWLANVAFLPLCFCFSFPSSLISGLFCFFFCFILLSLSLSVLPSLCFSFCQFSFSSIVLGVSVFLSFVFVLLVCLFLGSLLYVFSRLLCPLWFFPFLSCGVAILRYAVTSSPSMIITSIVASRGAKFFQLCTSSDPLPFIASKPQWAASRPP